MPHDLTLSQLSIHEQLRSLTHNLWWCWHPDVWQIFHELDDESGAPAITTPRRFCPTWTRTRSSSAHAITRWRREFDRRARRQHDYLTHRGPRANMEAGPLHTAPVAYFCAELACTSRCASTPEGWDSAGDHMKAASDLAVPIVGIGLFYALGYFRQSIDEQGWQQKRTTTRQTPIACPSQGSPTRRRARGDQRGERREHDLRPRVAR